MATKPTGQAVQHLVAACGRDGMTDGELLTRFLGHQDADAVAALVRRHGPMVWGVCRRMLRSHHDAEDAFQATFLVLVRKAATLPDRETVGHWLYGVAHQTAVRMRAIAARRGVRERQVAVPPEPATADQYVWNDLSPVLDEELSRLPGKYRVLIVLCDLEGVTRKEVARRLDLPEGTAASRLAAARAMLARRLARRGVIVSGVLLGSVLPREAAVAVVPTTVAASAVRAVASVATGRAATAGAIPATVAALTEGVLKTMFLSKLKGVLAAVLVAALVGGAGLIYATAATRVGTEAPSGPPTPPAADKSGAKDAETDRELAKFQGEWEAVSGEYQGRVEAAKRGDSLYTFDGNTLVNRLGGKVSSEATVALDLRKSPRAIDIDLKPGGGEGGGFVGIYEFAADGTLRLALAPKGGERPTDFPTTPATGHRLVVLRPSPRAGGEAVNGLRLRLQLPGGAGQQPTHCVVTLENVGDADLNVLLGHSLANGKTHHPVALRLVVRGAGGGDRTLTYTPNVPGVAGRLDPLVVPLPAGGTYSLRCRLDRFVDPQTGEPAGPTTANARVAAELTGDPVTEANPDLRGFTLMPYWRGTARSNEVGGPAPNR